MGLLDFFKSSGESRGKELSFAELGCWIIGEQERLGRDVVKQAQPLVKESERLVDGIRVSVKQLDATEIPENMFERAEKIVKTSKPDYVRSMNDAIKGLEYGRTDDFTGLLEFSASLEKTVNALGKIDATRGRYLFFGFEEQQKEIQRKGRKLMETQERLKKLLESDGRIREIGALMQQHNGINGLIAGREAAVKELSDVNARIKEAEGGIKETFSRLKEESSKKEYALLEALKERLSEARVERQNVEDKILRTISPFKKDLMKYRRNVYDARPRGIQEVRGVG
ncbi:MAG: hypothetical protein NTU61_05315 [Candidatus Altiarchaeota archaeon]|nr:hypothetical protein [Candidatus Altiarchaeota archaeon]